MAVCSPLRLKSSTHPNHDHSSFNSPERELLEALYLRKTPLNPTRPDPSEPCTCDAGEATPALWPGIAIGFGRVQGLGAEGYVYSVYNKMPAVGTSLPERPIIRIRYREISTQTIFSSMFQLSGSHFKGLEVGL